MRMMTTGKVLLVTMGVACCAAPARATDFTWNAPAPGNGAFESPFNWSPFNIFVPGQIGPPTAGEMATFDLGNSAYTVTFGANHTNSRCRIGDDAIIFNLAGYAYLLVRPPPPMPR